MNRGPHEVMALGLAERETMERLFAAVKRLRGLGAHERARAIEERAKRAEDTPRPLSALDALHAEAEKLLAALEALRSRE